MLRAVQESCKAATPTLTHFHPHNSRPLLNPYVSRVSSLTLPLTSLEASLENRKINRNPQAALNYKLCSITKPFLQKVVVKPSLFLNRFLK